MPNETPKDNDDGVTLPHVPQTGSHNARPSSNGFSARQSPEKSTSTSPPKGKKQTGRCGTQPVQDAVLLPAVHQQPGTAQASSENLKAEERLNQLVGVLVEATLARFSEVSEDEKQGKTYNSPGSSKGTS